MQNSYRKTCREDLGIDGKLIKWSLGKQGEILCNGFIWLRIETSGGLL
jgi:hypothetical protein